MNANITTSTEPAAETDAEFAKRFADLAATWKEETRYSSRMDKIAAHPAYREIAVMGERAVPLILADLEQNGGAWFMALREITKTSPVAKGDRGDVKAMVAAWLAWGYAQGYRWNRAI